MIAFSYQGRSQSLATGMVWRGVPSADTYRDTAASDLWSLVRTVESAPQ